MIIRSSGPVRIDCLALGELLTNCFILSVGQAQTREGLRPADGPPAPAGCWVVDPAEPIAALFRHLDKKHLAPERIVITHGHGDHISGVGELKRRHPQARVTAPRGDADMLTDARANLSAMLGCPLTSPPADDIVEPGQTLMLGELEWRVLDVSGHTPGGMALYCAAAKVVVAGDALFAGSIGRCDLPGGSESQLLGNIRRNLLSLPDDTAVLPGHGPTTTIGQERRGNEFLAWLQQQ